MKTTSTAAQPAPVSHARRLKVVGAFLPFLLLLLTIQSSRAQHGSATWSSDGTENLWGSLADWTPAVIPDGPDDTATFANSTVTYVDFDIFNDVSITLDGIHFVAGADAFTIADYSATMFFEGAGVVNDSGVVQSFITTGGAGESKYFFDGSSSAGTLTSYTMQGASPSNSGYYGVITFNDSSTAASATVTIQGGTGTNRLGGQAICASASSLDHATFTINGGASSGKGGSLSLLNSADGSQSTLVANGGSSGGTGGIISFKDSSLGGKARVQVFGNGQLDISGHAFPGVTIGVLRGSGLVSLGANILTIGSANASSSFSGIIQDGGASGGSGGSLEKIGQSTLTLSGASTYTGGTTVDQGTIALANTTGSATGTGPVQVNRGSLAGTGNVTGAITVGGTVAKPSLAPGAPGGIGTITSSSTLTFGSGGIYKADLSSNTGTADEVIATGVTLNSGALIAIDDLGSSILASGTVVTLISNTGATPITGTFRSLPDNSTLVVGANTYRVSYEGGTGNDLTLTVQ